MESSGPEGRLIRAPLREKGRVGMNRMNWKRMVAGLLCLLIIFSAVSSLAEIVKIRSGTLVRLRASASTKAKVLDAFPKGTRVNVLDKGAIWCKVRVDGKVGYMMTKYLYASAPAEKEGSSSSGSSARRRIRNGVLVRLRASASTKAEVLDAFPAGTTVTVLSKGSEWCRVRVDGKVGYMMTKYLYSDTSSGSSGSGSSGGGTTMYVSTPSGTTLNLRSDADTYSEILGAYRPGTKVTLLKRGRLWSKVSVNGLVGYMYTSYLSYTK